MYFYPNKKLKSIMHTVYYTMDAYRFTSTGIQIKKCWSDCLILSTLDWPNPHLL